MKTNGAAGGFLILLPMGLRLDATPVLPRRGVTNPEE